MRIAQLLIAALIALASGLGAQTFTDTATAAIPDGSRTGLTRTINIPATGNLIRSFRVDVRIDHQTDSDLDIYLIPPWVTWAGPYTLVSSEFSGGDSLNAPLPRGVIELSTDNGGTGNDYGSGNGPFTYARFSAAGDPVLAGTQAITAGAVAYTANVYLPEGVDAFEDVYGRNPSGTWTLVIADDTAGTAGNFRSWQITYAAVAASNLYAHLGANNDPGLPIKRGQAGQVLGQYRMEAVGAASNNLTSVVFRESAATNLNGLLTSASLYRDNNGDGLLDGGDTLLNTVVPAASPNITFNFAQAIPADTGVDLLLVGTVAAAPAPVSMQTEIQVAGSINSPLTEAGVFPRRAGPRPFVTATTFTYRPLQPDLITDDTDTGITRTITVPATTDRINSLRVGIRLDHTYDADLDFYLLPPGINWNPPYAVPGNGPVITAPPQVIELSTDNGGANNNWGSNLTNYTYTYGRLSGANDPTWAAANLVTGGASPFTAQPQYRIEGTTAWNLMYNGNPSGTWQLIAVDAWGQDVGYLISWQLEYVPITTPQFWANIGNNNNPGLAATTGTAGNVFGQLELSAYFGANSVTQIVARETNSFTIGNSLSAIALYRDVNANGTFEAGTDTLVANGAMAGAVATFNIGGGFNVASNTTEFLIIVGTVLALPANSVLTLQHTTNADIVGSTSEIAPYPLQYGAHPLNPPNTYVSTPPLGISIPDNNAAGITDTITIPATSDLIGALRIGVRIDHANDADLDIWLIPPGVTWAGPYTTINNGANVTPPAGVIELSTDNGGTGNDFGTGSISFVYARLSRNGDRQFNTGNTPVTGGAAPFTAANGYFTENIAGTNEFNDLYGTSPVGNWTIAIADDGSGGTGRLISWFVQYVPAERAQVKSVPTAGFTDFGNVIVGSPSAAQGFQVQNMGSFPLTLLAPGPLQGIRVTGANAGEFVIQATAPSGVLAADASTATFNIVFTPSALGLRTANITVTWNNSDATMPPTATSDYAITGTGVQPVIEVREVNVGGVTVSNGQAAANGRAFGNQDVALGPTAALTIVVRNTGTAAMTVGVPTLAGANPGDFVLNTAGYLTSIPAGSNTSFTVAFDPTVTGARGATVTFTHNGANTGSPFTFGVSGTGTTPAVEVHEVSTGGTLVTNGQAAANARAFGSRDIAAGPSATLTIFVLNTGTASMTLGTPTLGGANPGEFVLNTSGFTPTVAAGGNTSFALAFDPSVIGARNATISFTHTGSNTATPFTFSLSGTGTTPTIDVRETAVGGTIVTNGQAAANGRAFGGRDIAAGPSATLSIFVLNTGSAPMTVSLPSLGGVDASQFVLNTAGYTLVIGAGGNTSFTLAFDPSTTGAKAASISITHTGSNTATPFTFSLSGTGTTPTTEVREVSTGGTLVTNGQAAGNGRAFGNRDIAAGPSATLSIFVLNTGSATMTLALPVLAGADAGQFVLNTTGFALSLAPAANTSFTIAFDPSTVGAKSANISFTHTGSNTATPFTFSLSGTGTTPAIEVREVSTGGTVVTNGQAAANGRAFGNRDIAAGPTATLSIFVLNTGDATMTLALPVLGGVDASQFVLNTTGFALSLAPAANTSFTIAFDPSTVGAKAASISFTHSGSNTATPFTFSLSGTGTQPTVTVAASGSPNETGPVNGTFTITGAPAPSVARTVNFTMTGLASVTTGVDYTLSGADLISYAAGSGTLNLGVSGSATITLTPNNDAAIEALESATLTIVAGTDYAVGGANVATLNIIDNDAATINLANSGSPSEAPANGTFTISTPQTLEVALTISFSMSGVAVNADYTLAGTASFAFPSGSVTLGPGVAPSVNVTLTPVNDAFVEGPETAIMTITAGTQYSGTPNTTLTIVDNDSAVVTITSSGLPNEAGPVNGTYTVTVTPQPRNAMSVNLSLSGAAQFGAGFDYTISGAAISTPAGGTGPWVGTVAIPSGGNPFVSVNITLNTLNDTRVEATEIATLGATADTLLTDAAYTVGAPGSADLSILDDDIATVTVTQTGTAAEPGTAATYTITTTATLETNLTVNFTMSGTAQILPVADYNLASAGGTFPRPTGTAVIPSGLSSVVVTLTPVNDAIVEATETAIMTLNGGGQVSVGSPGNATINITDNDNALVSVTASGSPAEPATGGSYTISTSSVLETNVTVTFTMSGAATLALAQGSDFTLGNATYAAGPVGTAVILSGTGSVIVTFTPVNDAIVEPTESATMTINAVGSVTPTAPTFASFNIIDDDVATITVTASGAPAENPLAAGSYQISTVSTLELALTVNFTMSGTASTTSGVDYGLSGAGVTYSPGPTGTAVLTTGIGPRSVSVTLTPVNDAIVEGSETAILSVTAGTKYSGTPSDSRTILDDDVATITVSASGTPAEGGVGATFTIATSATLGSPLTVNFTLSGLASTVNGTDYTLSGHASYAGPTGTATLPAGASPSVLVTLAIFDDAFVEGPEDVVMTLNAGAYNIGGTGFDTRTISDNDQATISVTLGGSPSEAGPANGTFNISATPAPVRNMQVDFAMSGTASFAVGGDYTLAGTTSFSQVTGLGTVIIGVGGSVIVTLTPVNDAIVEAGETATLTVTADSVAADPAYIGTPAQTHTIADNDSVTVTVTSSGSPSESGVNGTYTIQSANTLEVPVTVTFAMSGVAANGVDYNLAGTGILPVGTNTQAIITLTPVNDARVEATEDAILTLNVGAQVIVGSPGSATLNILDNDVATVTVSTSGTPTEAGSVSAIYTLSTTDILDVPVTVSFLMSGAASTTPGTDYNLSGSYSGPGGSAVLPVGTGTSVNVTLTPIDDARVEANEAATLTVQTAGQAQTGVPAAGTLNITDNDIAVITVTPAGSPSEAGATGTYLIATGATLEIALAVNFTMSGAAVNADFGLSGTASYAFPGGSVTLAIGTGSSALVTLTPINDALVEGPEDATLTVTAGAQYSGTPFGTLTIADNDSVLITLSTLGSPSEAGPTAATFRVTATPQPAIAMSVNIALSGSATFGGAFDYSVSGATITTGAGGAGPWAGTVTIPGGGAGSTFVDITITPSDDARVEATESVNLDVTADTLLSDPAYTGTPSASLNITDNDTASVSVTSSGVAAEPGTGATYIIQSANIIDVPVTVTFTMSGSAQTSVGGDYNLTSAGGSFIGPGGTAILPVGTNTQITVTLTPVNDAIVEATETAVLTVLTAGQVTAASPVSASLNITDDDTATVNVSFAGSPSETGPTSGTFTLSTTATLEVALTVNFNMSGAASTVPGTDYNLSSAGGSYTGPGGTAVLPIGATPSVVITLAPIDDIAVEGGETATLTISGGGQVAVGTAAQTHTIADNDTPTVTISASGTPAEGSAALGTFTIATSATLAVPLTVNFTLSGLASTASGTDYTLAGHASYANPTGTATLPAGVAPSVNVTFSVFNDLFVEGPEDVVMTLNAGLYTVGGPGFGALTIADDDTAVITMSQSGLPSETGPAGGTYTITVTPQPRHAMSVNISLSGIAQFGGGFDYTIGGASITTPAGGTGPWLGTVAIPFGTGPFVNVVITLTPIDDARIEATETAALAVTADSVATDPAYSGTPSETLNIADNDSASVSVTSSGTASEAGAAATYTIQSASTLETPVTVNFTMSGSGTLMLAPGADFSLSSSYTGPTGSAVLPVGTNTFVIVTLSATDDAIIEATESATLTLNAGAQVTVGAPSAASLNITDNDVAQVSVTSSGTPTESGASATFTLSTSDTLETPISVSFNMSGPGTLQLSPGADFSISGASYTGPGGTATLPVGAGSFVVITLSATNDAIVEPTEIATLTVVTGGQAAATAPVSAVLGILDNDTATITVTSSGAPSESGATGTYTIATADTLEVALTVNLTMSGAAVNADYALAGTASFVFPSGSVTLATGVGSSAIVTLTPVNDAIIEATEDAILTLTTGTQWVAGAPAAATLNITDNDTATITVTSTGSPAEGGASATFTVSTTDTLAVALTINFTMAGLADVNSGVDYTLAGTASYAAGTGSVTLAAGVAPSAILTLNVNDDAAVEGPEDAQLNLAGGSQYSVGAPASATLSIADNDFATLSVTAAGSPNETGPVNGTYTITATPAPQHAMSVNFAMGGSASFAAGGDYTFSGTTSFSQLTGLGTATIPPSGSVVITLNTIDDAAFEATESATLSVSADSVNTDPDYIGTPSDTLNILDNDQPIVSVVGGPFNFGGTEINTFSAPSSYTVSGVFLTADIVINAPAQFQVALSAGGPWLSSLNLTPVANTVPSTNIFVRFAPTALGAAGGNVTNSSTSATTQNVAVSGNGTGITVSAASLGFGAQYVGTASAAQTYTVQAEGLSSDLIISAPAGFQLSSTGGAPWFASLNLGSGNIAPTLISVRFAPTSAGAASGNVSNSSSGFATRDVNVSGNGVAGVLGISGTQNHGSVAITQSGASILYTITNTATGPTAASLTVNSVTLGGANPGDFALSGFSTTLPTALSPGASFTFLGTFTPTAQGVRNADIIINSNTGTEPPSNTSYAINGTGTPGLFAATPTFPAQIDNGGPVVVRCVISALANTTADVAVEYIGGTQGTWTPATLVRTNAGSISGNVISAMSVAAAGSTLEIYWDAYATERHITAANYQIRFIPSNGLYGLGTTGTSSAFTLARQGGWAMHTIPTDLLTGRYGHASVFDTANDRAIVFGGHNGGQLNDVWAFDRSGFAQGWHKINVAGAPPLPRQYSTAVYDAPGQRMIMFGGYNTGVIRLNDVWALSLTRGSETWTQLAPSGTLPGARYYQSMALDAARNRALLFGGVTSSGNMNDVWALSLNVGSEAWTQLAPSGTAPTARFGSSIVIDAPRDRLVIYGGDTSSGTPSTQVFALSLSPGTEAWSTLSPATPNGAPAARELATYAYAANREALFIEGGYTAGFGYATDSWLLDLNGGETWTRIAPDIGASQGRVCGTAAYDGARGQLAIFGGLSMYGTIQTPLVLLDTSGTPAWSHPAGTSGAAVEPAQRWGASMVFDANFPGNGRVLTFGGASVGNRFNDVWYIDHTAATPQWVMLNPTGTAPPARTYAATIYDPTPGFERMIVFGGLSASNTVLNDLWVLDLSVPGLESWSQWVVGGGPSARYSSVALFDPNGGSPRMLLHGGNDGVRRNDVWALTLSGTPVWSLIPVASGTPSPGRFGHGATLDTAGNRLIVFYGNCIGGYLQDTWSFDLGTRIWTNISQPSGSRPSGREVFSSGSAGTRAYIHGGYGGSQLGDSWQLDVPAFPGTVTWTQFSSSAAPLARYGGCGCVDGNGRFVAGFGYLNVGASLAAADLWFIDPLNATPSWQLVNVAAQPSAQVTAASVFDPVNRRMIVFGGLRNGVLDNRLWQLDLAAPIATWSELATVTSVRPAPRRGAKFVYDPLNNRLVMYGGFLGATYTSVCNELWQLNLATGSVAWTQLFVSGGPPALSDCSFIYDPVSQSAVLFGGQQTSGAGTNGLWRLSLSGAPAWTTSTAVTRPAARLIHSAIYDAVGQRMIMFGGYNGLFDLWSYNIATDTWTQLFVANGPVGRYFHSAVYDSTPGFERMLVFGGYNAAARNDLWALDLRSGFPLSWTQLTGTAATPQPRWAHGAVFDTVGQRMVIAGGYTDGEIALQQEGGVADTWFYGR